MANEFRLNPGIVEEVPTGWNGRESNLENRRNQLEQRGWLDLYKIRTEILRDKKTGSTTNLGGTTLEKELHRSGYEPQMMRLTANAQTPLSDYYDTVMIPSWMVTAIKAWLQSRNMPLHKFLNKMGDGTQQIKPAPPIPPKPKLPEGVPFDSSGNMVAHITIDEANSPRNGVTWVKDPKFTGKMRYHGIIVARGYGRKPHAQFRTESGKIYEMTLKELDRMIDVGTLKREVEGNWTIVKANSRFTLSYVGASNDSQRLDQGT